MTPAFRAFLALVVALAGTLVLVTPARAQSWVRLDPGETGVLQAPDMALLFRCARAENGLPTSLGCVNAAFFGSAYCEPGTAEIGGAARPIVECWLWDFSYGDPDPAVLPEGDPWPEPPTPELSYQTDVGAFVMVVGCVLTLCLGIVAGKLR